MLFKESLLHRVQSEKKRRVTGFRGYKPVCDPVDELSLSRAF